MLHLALLNQFFHRPRHVFDGHVQVNPMLIEQINDTHLEPLERAFDGLLDVRGLTVQARRTRSPIAATQVEPEFGGDHHLLAERSEGFAHEFLVCEGAIHFSGIKERDPAFHGCPKKCGHLLLIFGRPVGKAHSHAAQPDGRDFQITFSKFALLHF